MLKASNINLLMNEYNKRTQKRVWYFAKKVIYKTLKLSLITSCFSEMISKRKILTMNIVKTNEMTAAFKYYAEKKHEASFEFYLSIAINFSMKAVTSCDADKRECEEKYFS